MVVYPEIESWDEFYPSEIFVTLDDADSTDGILKRAPVGSILYLGQGGQITTILKKVGEYEGGNEETEMPKKFVLLGYITSMNSQG